ncbi:MAG: type 1 glutamine amidotransferase [Candidatus Omnitrophica bacterium]|nr:type 1 glutamine amidotransferase [Candidatus Omnitrophota bacterium]
MILFIKHIDIEGPEMIGSFLNEKGRSFSICELHKGNQLPEDINSLKAVFCLGGPMNVYEEDAFPFLPKEHIFIQNVLQKEIPYLGICLGSQLLAKACGANVSRSPQKEVGFSSVQLTAEGEADPLFKGCEPNLLVYQWHEDMFHIPAGAKLLAQSSECPNQAFRIGKNAYGLQFHVEITDTSIREWSERYFDPDNQELQIKKATMLNEYQLLKEKFDAAGRQIFENFIKLIS